MTAFGALAVYQWLVILATARMTSSADLGALTLGLAVSSPVMLLTSAGLRLIQIRDVAGDVPFRQYLEARSVSVGLSFLVAVAALQAFDLSRSAQLIAISAIIVRCVEAVADSVWSVLIVVGAARQLAKALIIRATASVLTFAVVLVWTRRTALALLAVAATGVAILASTERHCARKADKRPSMRRSPKNRRLLRLLWSAFPLGIASCLTALNLNVPRYVLQAEQGPQSVAIFSVMASAFVVVSLFTAAIGHTAIPRLVAAVIDHDLDRFSILVRSMVIAGVVAGVLTSATGVIFGEALLRLFFGAPFATEMSAFRWLLATLSVLCVVTFLQDALTALNWKGVQVMAFSLGTLTTSVLCILNVPSGGVSAAALALFAGSLAELVPFTVAVAVAVSRERRWVAASQGMPLSK